jgi:hypothetical protein
MKRLAILLAMLVVGMLTVLSLQGQAPGGNTVDVFTPTSLSGGNLATVGALTARSLSTAYADTTNSISVRSYEHVYLQLVETASDTANLHIYARGSNDGVTYTTGTTADGAWTYVDSINWKPSTNDQLFRKCMEVPSTLMGFQTIQFKVHSPGTVTYGVGTGATASAPKVTYTVIRKFRK